MRLNIRGLPVEDKTLFDGQFEIGDDLTIQCTDGNIVISTSLIEPLKVFPRQYCKMSVNIKAHPETKAFGEG